jgi:integrase
MFPLEVSPMARDHNIWKARNGNALFFKLGIPRALRHHFLSRTGKPKTKIVEPLGTDSMSVARDKRDEKLVHYRNVFARFAAGHILTPAEIAGEQHRIRSGTLQAWQAMLAAPPEPMLPEVVRMIEAVRTGIAAQVEADRPGILAEVRAEARRIADEKFGPGIIAEGTPQWDEICRLVASTKAKAIEDHLFGRLRGTGPVEQPVMVPAAPAANGNGEKFSVAAEHYLAWLGNERGNRKTTVKKYRAHIERFTEFVKDAPLGSITIEQARAFIDDVAKGGTKAQTVNLYHHACRSVFEHARNERGVFAGENPFRFKRRKIVQQHKAKYTVEELTKLFTSPTFEQRQIKPKKYGTASAMPWAALIALYSGARQGEIVQLRPQDIRKVKGDGMVIDITAKAGALKNRSSERIIPLHPELVRLGLLKYLAALPAKAERIFPDLTNNALSKAFKTWHDSVGVRSTEDRKLDFHSFRHAFGKEIEDTGITATDRARLLGHAVPGISSSVYSAPELSRVAPLLAKVTWQGLRIK